MPRAARLVSLPGGLLLLLLTLQPPAAAGEKALSAGERAYQKCYSCHSLEGPDHRLQGPALRAIVGREVAAEESFAYSSAMRAYAGKQGRWTREALDAFIADPMTVVPGNEMGFFGIRDAEERRALIAYLADS
jgi:cytochrome c2